MRVQIPAYMDDWMRGDRYGSLVKVTRNARTGTMIAHVKLDKSGKTIRVFYDDCTEV